MIMLQAAVSPVGKCVRIDSEYIKIINYKYLMCSNFACFFILLTLRSSDNKMHEILF